MVSSRFVLPDPLGPPISACGEASASIIARGTPSTKPIGRAEPGPRVLLAPLLRRRQQLREGRDAAAPPLVLAGDRVAGVRHGRARQRRIRRHGDVRAGHRRRCDGHRPVRGVRRLEADRLQRGPDGHRDVHQTTEIPAARPPRSTRWTWSASASGEPSPTSTATTHGSERSPVCPRQRLERRVPTHEHPRVHPADPVRQLLQQPLEAARVVDGEQPGAGERVQAGQRAREVPDVPGVHLHEPGPEVPDDAQQQRLHQRLGRRPPRHPLGLGARLTGERVDLQVRLVEQRNADGEGTGAHDPRADPPQLRQRSGALDLAAGVVLRKPAVDVAGTPGGVLRHQSGEALGAGAVGLVRRQPFLDRGVAVRGHPGDGRGEPRVRQHALQPGSARAASSPSWRSHDSTMVSACSCAAVSVSRAADPRTAPIAAWNASNAALIRSRRARRPRLTAARRCRRRRPRRC